MLSGYSTELVGGSLANDTVSNLMKGAPDNNSFGLKEIFLRRVGSMLTQGVKYLVDICKEVIKIYYANEDIQTWLRLSLDSGSQFKTNFISDQHNLVKVKGRGMYQSYPCHNRC